MPTGSMICQSLILINSFKHVSSKWCLQVPWFIRVWWQQKELPEAFSRAQWTSSEKLRWISRRRIELTRVVISQECWRKAHYKKRETITYYFPHKVPLPSIFRLVKISKYVIIGLLSLFCQILSFLINYNPWSALN